MICVILCLERQQMMSYGNCKTVWGSRGVEDPLGSTASEDHVSPDWLNARGYGA